MAEQPTKVQLGAKEYQLRFTVADAIELQKRLGRRGFRIMKDLLGMDDEGKFTLEFDIEALVACLQVGMRHARKATEEQVVKWVQEHVDNKRPIGDLIGPVVNAVNQSGAFGFRLEAQPDDDEGKDDPALETT